MPLSLCSVMAKVLTYWSYDAVPVAIAHTCKVRVVYNKLLLFVACWR